ncbi:MAG: sugar ABC transporter ATP-binding protein [Phycisphaerales bacterium]
MEEQVMVHLQDLHKTFGSTKAVDGVSLDIDKGEIRGLVGENGSGKSTLMCMVAGLLKPDSGSMTVEGQPYAPQHQAHANDKGVSMIVQEVNTLAGMTVAENIFVGHEQKFINHGLRDLKAMFVEAKEYLEEMQISGINVKSDIDAYTLEQRKLIELVRAAHIKPKLLIIDETTTVLSQKGRAELYKLIHKTKDSGNSVVFISHDLREVLDLCDSVTVMRDGQLVDTVSARGMSENDLKSLMVGRDLVGSYYREDYGMLTSSEVVLEVRNLNCPGKLNDVSFELYRGEILGFGGLSESGMHNLGKALFGVEYNTTGSVTLEGETINIHSIKEAIKSGIGYVPKDREHEALINNADILDNICITCMDQLQKGVYLSPIKKKNFAREQARRLNIKMNDVDQFVYTLSGGNKQKVTLTKWLARGANIFVLDSPTRGIDVMTKAMIYDLLTCMKNDGCSIIVISEELLELIGVSDRILILKNGNISGEFVRSKDLSEEDLVSCMI